MKVKIYKKSVYATDITMAKNILKLSDPDSVVISHTVTPNNKYALKKNRCYVDRQYHLLFVKNITEIKTKMLKNERDK